MLRTGAKWAAAIVPLAALLGLAVLMAVRGWNAAGDARMSASGWIALCLGAVVTLAAGGAISALLIYSARHGYDEPPHFDP